MGMVKYSERPDEPPCPARARSRFELEPSLVAIEYEYSVRSDRREDQVGVHMCCTRGKGHWVDPLTNGA